MKAKVHDPMIAAKETGGVTFEPATSWWTQCASTEQAERLGTPFADSRDAIYIPTVQKNGEAVSRETVSELKAAARRLGLIEITRAAGAWVLTSTGEIQTETVWIASAPHGASAITPRLAGLASHIRTAANQDCVAYEVAGELRFTATDADLQKVA